MQHDFRALVVSAVLLALIPFGQLHARSPEGVFEVPADGLVTGIINGRPVRVRIEGDLPKPPVVSPVLAEAASFRPSIFHPKAKVGPEELKGSTTVVDFAAVGSSVQNTRVIWFSAPFDKSVDVSASPQSLGAQAVVFRLRKPSADEHQISLPMVELRLRVGAIIKLGDVPVFVQWSLASEETVATASAAVALADRFAGHFTGDIQQLDQGFGVMRPVREVTLEQGAKLGPLAIDRFLARTSDYGRTNAISDAEQDPSEIVVTAKGKPSQSAFTTVRIGRGAMRGCSSITYDFSGKRIVLSCR